ncbi:MAG: adenylate/guanylate cyclase domain-containing protein [Pseudomonadota bacterium]
MRISRFQARARPFRYAGFWTLGVVYLIEPGRPMGQVVAAVGFCVTWPFVVDRLLTRVPGPQGRVEQAGYVAECGVVAAVLTWAGVTALAGLATVVCLLAGATALAGWRLLLPAAAALLLGGWAGAAAPAAAGVAAGAPGSAVDALAMALILGFSLALAHVSFRQARRLAAQRLALAERSAELERLNRRMQRYLPPSLRHRLARDPEQPAAWERRWLTVVFVDLAGFTELSEVLDAEPLAEVLDEYLGALVPAAEERGGEVSKLLGDGVMVVFAARDEADRRTAVTGALAFCEALPALLTALAAGWRARGELVRLRTRAGVASGFCTVGDRGGAERLDFTLIGGPVNLASRLQAHAPLDGVLLDESSAALAEHARDFGPPRAVTLKGLGTVPAYALS